MKIYFLILFPLAIIFLSYYLKKISFGLSYTGEGHQRFVEKDQIPIIGGIFIVLGFVFFLDSFSQILKIHIFLIFFLGILSDFKYLNSPKIRFLIQIIIISSFVYFNNLEIFDTRVIFLDEILTNKYFNFIFVLFCVLILVNGSNFIDGLNTLLIGYYLIILINLLNSNLIPNLDLLNNNYLYWTILISILFIFNFIKKLFMGDSGAYALGLIFSFILIKLHEYNDQISPFFILLLVWYPSYELLFSIIRKFKFGLSPVSADNKHFHQLLYFYFSKKLKIKENYLNSFTGVVINLYNFIIIYLAFLKSGNTQFQFFLILINLGVYTYIYLRLFLFRFEL